MQQSIPLPIRAYLAVSRFAPGLWKRIARKQHLRQAADPARFDERIGRGTVGRPEGPLIWLHAASVGELMSMIGIGGLLAEKTGATLLFTTLTQTAAEVATKRAPRGSIHQFLPIDTPSAVTGFLRHWRPDLVLFSENDLWPRLILEISSREIPLALINTRPSRTRQRAPDSAAYLLSHFDRITTQTEDVRQELLSLGLDPASVLFPGELKAALSPLPADPDAMQEMLSRLGDRSVWIAASTHDREEEMVAAAHKIAAQRIENLLLILIPRHPDRGEGIAADLRASGHRVARRSLGEALDQDSDIYLADTLGETGLFYRVAPLVFLGGSFTSEGGHNPFEPAQLGAAVLTGPNVANFAQAFADLRTAGASCEVASPEALGQAVAALLGSDELVAMQDAARQFMESRTAAQTHTIEALAPLLSNFVHSDQID